MPRVCAICTHPERAEIDRALLAGGPYRTVAGRFGAQHGAVFRHKSEHVPRSLVADTEEHEVERRTDMVELVHELVSDAHRIKRKAEGAGDLRTALAGIRELTRLVELVVQVPADACQHCKAEAERHLHAFPEPASDRIRPPRLNITTEVVPDPEVQIPTTSVVPPPVPPVPPDPQPVPDPGPIPEPVPDPVPVPKPGRRPPREGEWCRCGGAVRAYTDLRAATDRPGPYASAIMLIRGGEGTWTWPFSVSRGCC